MKTNDLKRQLAAVTAVALTFSSMPAVAVGAEEVAPAFNVTTENDTFDEGSTDPIAIVTENAVGNVTLKSDNTAVATVDGMNVTFTGNAGVVTITATDDNGTPENLTDDKTDTVTFTVTDNVTATLSVTYPKDAEGNDTVFVTANPTSNDYINTTVVPAIKVMFDDYANLPVAGADYTVDVVAGAQNEDETGVYVPYTATLRMLNADKYDAEAEPIVINVYKAAEEISPVIALAEGKEGSITVDVSDEADDAAKKAAAIAAAAGAVNPVEYFTVTVNGEAFVAENYTITLDEENSTVNALVYKLELTTEAEKKYSLAEGAETNFEIAVNYNVTEVDERNVVTVNDTAVSTATVDGIYLDDSSTEIELKCKDAVIAAVKTHLTTDDSEFYAVDENYTIAAVKGTGSTYVVTVTIADTTANRYDAEAAEEYTNVTVTESTLTYKVAYSYTANQRNLTGTIATVEGETTAEINYNSDAEAEKAAAIAAAEALVESITFVDSADSNKVITLTKDTDYTVKTEAVDNTNTYAVTITVELTDAAKVKYTLADCTQAITVSVSNSGSVTKTAVTPAWSTEADSVDVNINSNTSAAEKQAAAKAAVEEAVKITGVDALVKDTDYTVTYTPVDNTYGTYEVVFTLTNTAKYYLSDGCADEGETVVMTKTVNINYISEAVAVTPVITVDTETTGFEKQEDGTYSMAVAADGNKAVATLEDEIKAKAISAVSIACGDVSNVATTFKKDATITGNVANGYTVKVTISINDVYAEAYVMAEDAVTEVVFTYDIVVSTNVDIEGYFDDYEENGNSYHTSINVVNSVVNDFAKAKEAAIKKVKEDITKDITEDGLTEGFEVNVTTEDEALDGDEITLDVEIILPEDIKYVYNIDSFYIEDSEYAVEGKLRYTAELIVKVEALAATAYCPVFETENGTELVVDVYADDTDDVVNQKIEEAVKAATTLTIYDAEGNDVTEDALALDIFDIKYGVDATTVVPKVVASIALKDGVVDYALADVNVPESEDAEAIEITQVTQLTFSVTKNIVEKIVEVTPAITVADVTVADTATAEEIEAAIENAARVTFTDAEGNEVADIAYELAITDAADEDAATYTVAVASISTEGYSLAEVEATDVTITIEATIVEVTPAITVADVTVADTATAEEIEAAIENAAKVTFTDAEGNEVADIAYELAITDAADEDAATYTVAVASISTEGYSLAEVEATDVTITIEATIVEVTAVIEVPETIEIEADADAVEAIKAAAKVTFEGAEFTAEDYTIEVTAVEGEENTYSVTVALTDAEGYNLSVEAKTVVVTVKAEKTTDKWIENEDGTYTWTAEDASLYGGEDASWTNLMLDLADYTELCNEDIASITVEFEVEGNANGGIGINGEGDAWLGSSFSATTPTAVIDCSEKALADYATQIQVQVYWAESGDVITVKSVTVEEKKEEVAETETAEITACVAQNGQIALNWAEVEGAQKYAIYMWTKGSGIKCVGTRDAGVTGAYVKGLTNGAKYGLLVRTFNGEKWSAYEAADWAYTTPYDPAKPAISACVPSADKVALNWTPVKGAEKYAIYTYVDGKYKCVGGRAADVTGMYVRNLESGKKYGFLVRAYVDGKWTTYSEADIAYATTL